MSGNLSGMLIWMAAIFAFMYFIIIRPNKKQQNERRTLLESIKVKDKVITIGGVHGTITKMTEDTVTIKVAPNVDIEFLRTAIQSIENRDYKEETTSSKGRKLKRTKGEKVEETQEADNAPSENPDVEAATTEENK